MRSVCVFVGGEGGKVLFRERRRRVRVLRRSTTWYERYFRVKTIPSAVAARHYRIFLHLPYQNGVHEVNVTQ